MNPQQIRFATIPAGAELDSMNLTISQKADCCAPTDLENYLEVTTPDGGGGKYLVISGRWAMDDASDVDSLANFLKGVLAGVSAEVEPEANCEQCLASVCDICLTSIDAGKRFCESCESKFSCQTFNTSKA